MENLLTGTTRHAIKFLESLEQRKVFPTPEAIEQLNSFYEPLPSQSMKPEEVINILNNLGTPALVANAGGRYFGFVIGGSLPAALAANWLAGAWDQNAFSNSSSPLAAALEEISLKWIAEALVLPSDCGGAFVTGATMANFSGLAAARHKVLEDMGWDVENDGLFGAPPIKVVVGEEAHSTLFKALGLLGLGRKRVLTVPVDGQGRMKAEALPPLDKSTIVCIQAGNVNTGAFDPAEEICAIAHAAGAWVHVDGAFGLWALATPNKAHLAAGFKNADSWATDAHKWLNVPYDSGVVLVRNPKHLYKAMSISATYLPEGMKKEPFHYTPETSRRARGIESWAALKSLGRLGLIELIERNCRFARLFAERLRAEGYEILNEVQLNQVLVSFGSAEITGKVIAAIQADGTCWCGGTTWQGHVAMRISVSSWCTTEEDVEQSLAAMLRIATEIVDKEAKE